MSRLNDSRLATLQKLLDRYQQTVEDYDEGEEEDLRPYFDGEKDPARYVCVTVNYTSHGHAKHFFLPEFTTVSAATIRAVEFAQDDIFEELPVAVVDLDTGREYTPLWHTLCWTTPSM